MKKKLVAIIATCAAITMAAGLAACDNSQKEDGTYYTVTYMDGTTTLKTERVKEGEVAPAYTPTKDGGYEFVDWFATPSKNHRADMTAAVTGDITVYAGFSLYENDTRDFYIIGNGSSTVLIDGWGVATESHKLTKDPDKNEYTITLDVLAGDEFVFAANEEYYSKRGAGYMLSGALEDGTSVFSGMGSVYDDSSKGKNIVCEYSGNYTFTLKTYPKDDYYNTEGQGYTEDRKEIYRMGTYDTISWERNGAPVVSSITINDYFIKGATITGWANVNNSYTRMVRDGKDYSMSIYLNEGEEFMFASRQTVSEDGKDPVEGPGSATIVATALDTASLNYLDKSGNNMKAKASGTYTFNYSEETKVLSVTFVAGSITANDYYLDGVFGGHSWDETKMVALTGDNGVYSVTLNLAVGDILCVRSYAAGTTNPTYSGCATPFNYAFLKANSAFENNSNNIGCLTAGTYTISIDNYTKIITIVDANADPNDIYIKGGMNGWAHNFSADWRLTRNAENNSLYEITLDFEADWELGLAKYAAGESTGNGDWIGLDNLGTSGDANDKFAVESGNLKCNTAGKYRVVYNVETQKLDFYTAS